MNTPKLFSDIVTLQHIYENPLPAFQEHDDVKYPESLVRYLLNRFSKEGDSILDPFTGLGTSFIIAEEMARTPYGVEADPQRYEWTKSQVKSKDNLIFGDSAKIKDYGFPSINFSLTSPPYMPADDDWNPLYEGDPKFSGYDVYLKGLQDIYAQILPLMTSGAHIVIQADNLSHRPVFCPLVWDIGRAISQIIPMVGEIIVRWSDDPQNENSFTQCLVFQAP